MLTGNSTYTGPTTIGAGTLQIGDGVATTGGIGPGNIVNNGTLVFNKPSGSTTVEWSNQWHRRPAKHRRCDGDVGRIEYVLRCDRY